MEFERPSELYVIFQRAITFLDEWLFYCLLLFLLMNDRYLMMVPVAILGTIFIGISYRRQWKIERQRFGD